MITTEPSWTSPWGQGRPGWHIECSVMSHSAMQQFGAGNLDIHAGNYLFMISIAIYRSIFLYPVVVNLSFVISSSIYFI